MQQEAEKRTEAFNALVRIVVLEAAIIAVAVGVWFASGRLDWLIGGLIGSQIIAAPMLIRWVREHAPALKKPAGNGS